MLIGGVVSAVLNGHRVARRNLVREESALCGTCQRPLTGRHAEMTPAVDNLSHR